MTVKNETSVPQDFILPIMQMLDSVGKIPPGLFKGALTFWGYYPECKNISYRFTSRNRLWETEYSRAWYNLGFKDGRNPDNCKAVSDSGVPTIFGGIDLCLPKGCNSNDVLTLVQSSDF
uniref:Nose resistant-to-fluoxetine protein N-terminal domain-containing protein n=1 Tax=Acrobeloides nanus TaxID=290746 RepID=A0A914EGG0_9BILA